MKIKNNREIVIQCQQKVGFYLIELTSLTIGGFCMKIREMLLDKWVLHEDSLLFSFGTLGAQINGRPCGPILTFR